MALSNWTALHRTLPDRKLKLFVVGIGLGFWLCWGTSALLLVEGHPLSSAESCAPIDDIGLFWDCTTGKAQALLVATLNALVALTLAVPVFIVGAQINPSFVPLALPGVLFHAIGLPAGLFVLVRSCRRLFEQFTRSA